MTNLERAIEAVECGLLPVSGESNRPIQIHKLVERMKHYKVPGFSVALIDQEEVAWARGYGVGEVGCTDPVNPETVFQAASISKAVAAIMALRLVDQGLIDLDADVNDVLRTWKVPKSKHTQPRPDGTCPVVTLRGLLLHSAGISPAHYMGYPVGEPLPTLRQILDGKPLAYPRPVRVKEDWEIGDFDQYLEFKRAEFIALLEQLLAEGKLFFSQEITQEVIDFVHADPEISQGMREGDTLAIDVLGLNIHAFPRQFESYLSLARLYLRKGECMLAEEILRKVLSIKLENSAVLDLLAKARAGEGL